MEKIANNTACLVNVADLNRGFSFDQKTTRHYLKLLSLVYLVTTLQPWHNNRNKRLVKTPKLHITDTGLLSNILKLSTRQLLNDSTLIGRVLETFIFNELVKQASWYEEELQFYHYRDKDLYEVDIVALNEHDQILGIEVKLAASVTNSDFRGLRRLKQQYPERFHAGHVFYDGEQVLSFGDGMYAVPIQLLWSDG